MTSDDLTAEQASRLYEALFPNVNYSLRLDKKRLEELRFPDEDPPRRSEGIRGCVGPATGSPSAISANWCFATTLGESRVRDREACTQQEQARAKNDAGEYSF